MSLFFYNIFLFLYALGIRIFALFNAKAAKWIKGRRDWENTMRAALPPGEMRIWIHVSSLGEYEQGRPLIEALKNEYPHHKIVLTFFSPSGYDAVKKNALLDYVFYMPLDGRRTAEKFVAVVAPSMALFVKYDFWYYYLRQLSKAGIPALLVSAAFRKEQSFFKWHGSLFRSMLGCFSFLFVQDEESKRLLANIGLDKNVQVAGDTRYDRVAAIAGNTSAISEVERFKGDKKLLIAGSTWPEDEAVLKEALAVLPPDWKLVLVPHEIDVPHISKIQQLFDDEPVLFTHLTGEITGAEKRILIVNTMGMLSRMYVYGDIAFVGGGFQKGGIHNILEPAVFGLPVLFGPVYRKFVEARTLAGLKYVFPVKDADEAKEKLKNLMDDGLYYQSVSTSLQAFMRDHIGASAKILATIRQQQWLEQ